MKNILLTLAIVLSTLWSNAQNITVSGNVLSKNEKEPLINVAIAFYDNQTNKIITYAYSDIDGKYNASFKAKPFYIKANLLGFINYKSSVLNYSKNAVAPIILQQSTEVLNEVIVVSKRKMITLKGDKMIIDIEHSGIGDGNNAIETLSKLPGIRLDKDENILFRGDGNLQILIDGKPTLLSGDALKQYLKTVSGNNIKSVEIIANPSAKYDASGTGGILNIRLKKATVTGLTGNVYSNVGYAEFIKQSNGINLYNNTKKWNFNAGLYHRYNESVNHRNVIKTIEKPNQKIVLEQKNEWLPISTNFTTKFGAAYTISKNASLGATINYNTSKSDETTIGKTRELYNNNYLKYTLLSETLKSNKNRLTGNMHYSFASDSLDTKFNAQLNYAHYDNKEEKLTKNQYLNTVDNLPYTNNINVQNNNPTTYTILTANIDFEKKVSKTVSFETGTKYSIVNNDYNQILKNQNLQGEFIFDHLKSNHLIYNESIFSLYGIANFNTNKWSLQAGLRSEYIDYDATSKTNNKTNYGTNLSLFPSLSINRNFENNQYKLAYSRRIQRPRYLNLNPFFKYVDTYNIEVGNPNLKPQFSTIFDFTWVNKRKTSISLYAKFVTDEMDTVFDYDEITQITTMYQDNIASSDNIGLSINTSLDATEWWSIQFSSDFSYNHIKSNITDYSYDIIGNNWYASINQSIKLKKDWKISWNSFYNSGGAYGNTTFKPSYDTSFGIKKRFFNKKLRLNLKATNILKQSKWHSITKQDNIHTDWTNRWETRKFSLSLTYNFGNGKKKKIKDANLWDEKNRL